MTRWLTLEEFRQVCFDYAATADWVKLQPIPDFDTRYPNVLESCLETPQQTFDKKLLYPTLIKQAAMFFYLLNKSHPFVNGNKRISLVALGIFLIINGKLIISTSQEFHDLTLRVADSDPRNHKQVVKEIEEFIGSRIAELTPELADRLMKLTQGEP